MNRRGEMKLLVDQYLLIHILKIVVVSQNEHIYLCLAILLTLMYTGEDGTKTKMYSLCPILSWHFPNQYRDKSFS